MNGEIVIPGADAGPAVLPFIDEARVPPVSDVALGGMARGNSRRAPGVEAEVPSRWKPDSSVPQVERRITERSRTMAMYVSLVNFTDQGVRTIKDTTKRAKAFVELAQKAGVKVKDLYWTLGRCDLITITEAPDDGAVTALLLSVGALGNVRTETLRAYSAEDMERILARMP
jgi:uncharacterized protein with GYD domain